MTNLDTLQIVIIGAGTGFGSALGTELAHYVIGFLKRKRGGEKVG